jgi:hypothetical protein
MSLQNQYTFCGALKIAGAGVVGSLWVGAGLEMDRTQGLFLRQTKEPTGEG